MTLLVENSSSSLGLSVERGPRPAISFDLPPRHILPWFDLNKSNVPVPRAALALALSHNDLKQVAELTSIVVVSSREYSQVIAPCMVTNGKPESLADFMTPEKLKVDLGIVLNSEEVREVHKYWQLDAMIGGPFSAGLAAGRLLTARLLHAKIPVDDPNYAVKTATLGSMYGFPSLEEYSKKLAILTKVAHESGNANVAILESQFNQDPVAMYALILAHIAPLWNRLEAGESLSPVEIQSEHEILANLSGAKGGMFEESEIPSQPLIAGIRESLNLYRDLLLHAEYPGLTKVISEIIKNRFPVTPAMRYNTFYLSEYFFIPALEKLGMLTEGKHDNTVIAGLKPIASLAKELLNAPKIVADLKRLADLLDIDGDESTSFVIFEKILERRHTMSAGTAKSMINQCIRRVTGVGSKWNDLGRCRIWYQNDQDLDVACKRASQKIRFDNRYHQLQRAILSISPDLQAIHDRFVSLGKIKLKTVRHTPEGDVSANYPLDSGRGAATMVRGFMDQLPVEESGYAAIHAHLELPMAKRKYPGGLQTSATSFVEIQMRLHDYAKANERTSHIVHFHN